MVKNDKYWKCALYDDRFKDCQALKCHCDEEENRYTCPFYKPDTKLVRFKKGKDTYFKELSETQKARAKIYLEQYRDALNDKRYRDKYRERKQNNAG